LKEREGKNELHLTWRKWESKLAIFEGWRKKYVNPLIRAWWLYLFDVFFHEVSTLSNSAGLCLDVGCGSGSCLCRLVKEGERTGVGLDPLKEGSLKIFKDRIKGYKISEKIELIRGVGEYLPIKKDCVQTCITTGVIDHVNNPNQTVKEIHRVLVSDGYFLLLESVLLKNRPSFYDETHLHHFTIVDLKRLLRQFRIQKIRKFFPVLSQLHIPDKLLDSNIYKALSKMPSVIGCYFNYSEVFIKSKKN